VNGRNNNGKTPLVIAARYGKVDACHVLLKHGAAVNLRDKQGWVRHEAMMVFVSLLVSPFFFVGKCYLLSAIHFCCLYAFF